METNKPLQIEFWLYGKRLVIRDYATTRKQRTRDSTDTDFTGVVLGRRRCSWRIGRSVEAGSFRRVVRVESQALINLKHGRRRQMLVQIIHGEIGESGTEVLMGRVECRSGCRHRYEIHRFVVKIPAERANNQKTKPDTRRGESFSLARSDSSLT